MRVGKKGGENVKNKKIRRKREGGNYYDVPPD